MPFRQHGGELHTIAFGIVAVLAAASARRLDHDPYIAVVAEGRDFGQDGVARGTGRHKKTHENQQTNNACRAARFRPRASTSSGLGDAAPFSPSVTEVQS